MNEPRSPKSKVDDITELKSVVERLRKSEEQYRTLIQTIPDITYELDPDGKFVFVSDAIEQLGYKPEELIGKHFREIIHPDDLKAVSRSFVLPKYKGKKTGDAGSPKLFDERRAGVRMTKSLEVRLMVKNKKGASGDYQLSQVYSTPRFGALKNQERILRDDRHTEVHSSGKWGRDVKKETTKFLGSIGIIRDITERKRMEGEIKKAQERLSGIYSCSKDAIGYADLEGVLLDFNDSFAKLTGYSKEELLAGKKYQDITPKEYHEYEAKIIAEILKTGEPQEYEKEYLRKDGSRVPILLTTFVVKGLEGKPIGLAAIMKDISERKRAYEEEKRLVAARAAAEVEKKRAVELSRAYKELEEAEDKLIRSEKLAALGKLAGSLGHELRNVLGVIGNSAYFLKMKLGETEEDEKIKKHLDILDGEVKISDRIISDIMEFGRARKPQLAITDINGIIKSCLEKVEVPENTEVVTELGNNLPQILADETRLKQVFSNIIVNAVQAMPEGGKLTIAGFNKDKFVEVSITDTGEGIPKENLGKIFEALFSTKGQGTGLGLTVCQSIVERHNGSIEVKSEVGKGTKFSVKLPVTNKEH